MKKILLCGLLLISVNCFSQDAGKGFLGELANRLSFGLRAGVNYSNFNNAPFPTDPLPGFNAGATVNLNMSRHWSVAEDFLYATEGAKSTSAQFGNTNIKLSYINVPILFRYKTNAGIFIEAGEQAGIKLKENIAGQTDGDFAKKLNFGLVGGFGYQSGSGLGISVRYIYGLSKVADANSNSSGYNFKSSTAQLNLFYTF